MLRLHGPCRRISRRHDFIAGYQACRHGGQRLHTTSWHLNEHLASNTSATDYASFPPRRTPAPPQRKADAADKATQEQNQREYNNLVVRLRRFVRAREKELQDEDKEMGVKQKRKAMRNVRMASDILKKARGLRAVPTNWPSLGRTSISVDALAQMHEKAMSMTEKDIQRAAEVFPEPSSPERSPPEQPQNRESAEESKGNDEEKPAAVAEKAPRQNPKAKKLEVDALSVSPKELQLHPLDVEQDVELRPLHHGLDRVLFNPGVTFLRDPRSRVFNFDPYLATIMPVDEFDFEALGAYITSSKDETLINLAHESGAKYVGSTSSMTSILSHLHYLISRWRPLNLGMLSKSFQTESENFTKLLRLPVSVILRHKDGVYAIDSDKMVDEQENILMFLGRSMEKMMTMPPEIFEKYHKSKSHEVPEEVKNARERYHYTRFDDMIFRSQLDAHDSRLPGTGVFDLKTRGVVSIRMNSTQPAHGWGYQIKTADGQFESFEREYYDLIRAAFMKYSLQVRMGRMDGCFVAYHNTKQIFGFQYISIDEMDQALHGDTEVGNQEFKLSLKLLNEALDRATEKYPGQSLRLWFEARESTMPFLYFAAEPITDEEINQNQAREADIKVVLEQMKIGNRWAEDEDANEVDKPAYPIMTPLEELQADDVAEAQKKVDQLKESVEMLDAVSSSEETTELTSATETTSSGNGQTFAADAETAPETTTILDEVPDKAIDDATDDASDEITDDTTDSEDESSESASDSDSASDSSESESDSDSDSNSNSDSELESQQESKEAPTAESPRDDLFSKVSDATVASYLNSATTQAEKDQEFFLQVLVTQSMLNGFKVDRPQALRPTDEWSLNYAFLDMEKAAAERVMGQMKKRKAEGIEYSGDFRGQFMKNLKELSEKGLFYADHHRKIDDKEGVVVYERRG